MRANEIDPVHSSLIFTIEPPLIQPAVARKIEADGFCRKSEFHITLVPSDIGQKIGLTALSEIREQLDNPHAYDLQYSRMMYRVNRSKLVDGVSHLRSSLVVAVSCEDLEEDMEEALDCYNAIPEGGQFLHITIATAPHTAIASRGIGISSAKEWTEYAPKVYAKDWEVT